MVAILAGVAGAGVLGAAGFAVVRAGLPPPTRSHHVAAHAATWLQSHRLVLDELRIDGRQASGACLRGWRPRDGGRPQRGSFLSLRPGTVWFASSLRRVSLARGPRQPFVLGRLETTAGCTRGLRDVLFAALQTGLDVGVTTGQRAIALSLPEVRGERVTLYVSAQTYRPLLAVAAAGGHEVVVHLRFVRATPAVLARSHLLPGSLRGDRG